MELPAAIELAIDAFQREGIEDGEVVEALVGRGVSPALAGRIVAFLPMAFAQTALSGPTGATFGTTYVRRDEDGATTEHALAEEPVFVEALAAAQRDWGSAARSAVAGRSAELDAINAALHHGSRLEDLELGPTVIPSARLPPLDAAERDLVSRAHVELVAESSRLRRRLGELLRAHGLVGGPGASGYEVAGVIAVDGAVWSWRTGPGYLIVQIDVRVAAPRLGGRAIVESCGGVGATIEAAVGDAFSKFCRSSLHPLLAALVDESLGHEQVEWETWTGGDRSWRACLGALLRQSTVPAEVGYAELLDALRARWLADPSPIAAPHWLRVWFMMGPEGRIGTEVLLDNEPWAPGLAVLDAAPWPITGQTYVLRHFLVVLPASA